MKKETPTSHSGLPGGAGEHAQETSYIKKEPRSRRILSSHRGQTNKRQKTQHTGSYIDKLTTGSSAIHTTPKTHTQGQQMQPTPALSVTESDVKPDTKVFHGSGAGGDFMSRVSKGGKWLFIEEYPQAGSSANEGTLSGRTDRINRPHAPTAHPTCVPQLSEGQNFFHDPAASGVIQRWETNTRCLTWPGVTQAGEVNTRVCVYPRSRC